MFSTLAGCCLGGPGNVPYTGIHKAAAGVDFAGFVTMVVLGVLVATGTCSLPMIGSTGGCLLAGGGVLGLVILAIKNIKNVNP